MKEYEANAVLAFTSIALVFSMLMAFSETSVYFPF